MLRLLFSTLIFLSATFAAADNLNYLKQLETFKGRRISKVIKTISSPYLIKHIGHYFHPENSTLDLSTIKRSIKLLHSTGRFSNISITGIINSDETATLTYKLIPITRIHKTIFEGHSKISEWKLNELIPIRQGEPLDRSTIIKSRNKILKLYKENGYYNAKVSYFFEKTLKNRVNVIFKIVENEPLRVSKITFRGATQFHDELVKKLNVKANSRVSQNLLIEDMDSIRYFLYSMHYPLSKVHSPTFSENDKRALVWNIDLKDHAQFIFRPVDPFRLTLFKDKPYDINEFMNFLNLNQYSALNSEVLKSINESVLSFFKSKGFIDTTVKYHAGYNTVHKRPQHVFAIDEGSHYTYDIDFEGTKKVENSVLKQLLINASSKLQSHIFSEDEITNNLNTILNYYKSFGFLNAQINEKITFTYDKLKHHVDVLITINENKETVIQDIRFSGSPKSDELALIELSDLKAGTGLNPFMIEIIVAKIENYYKIRGHYFANVETKDIITYSPDNRSAELNFKIYVGPVVKVGEIILNGNYISHDRIITREIGTHYYMSLAKGDIFTPDIIKKAQEKISATGVFQSVSITPIFQASHQNTVDLIVKVIEKDPGLIKFGIGYKNERGLRVFGSIINNNIGGMNRTTYVKGELNQHISSDDPLEAKYNTEYVAQLGFIEPWLFNSRARLLEHLTLSGNMLFEKRDNKSFRIDQRRQISFALDKTLSKYGDLTVSYQFEKDIGYNKAQDKDFSDMFGIFTPTLELDHRDNSFNPTTGIYNKFTIDYASSKIYSSFDFYKARITSNLYFRVFKGSVVATSIRAGTSKAFSVNENGEKKLPILFRYFLGGRSTVRGYDQDELGPMNNDKPLGGEHFFNYKTEIRVPITKDIGTVFFIDGGNVYSKGYSYTIRHSYGAGLRYYTPIGPISFEYGVKVNPADNVRRSAIHFSIGSF